VLHGLTAQVRATVSGVDLALRFQWFVFVAVVLMMLDTLLMLRARRRRLRSPDAARVGPPAAVPPPSARRAAVVAATVLIATMTVTTLACREPTTPPHRTRQSPPPDTVHLALYNHGTRFLQHDSLAPAIPLLDAAQASADSTVQFRSAFNDGWAHLMTSLRTITTLAHGGPKADSLLVTLAPKAGDSARQVAAAYVNQHLDATLAQYQAALVRNPTDADAKWNYELAYRLREVRQKEGNGDKTGDKKRNKKSSEKKGDKKSDKKKNDKKHDNKDKKNKQQQKQQQKQEKQYKKEKDIQPDKKNKNKQQKGKTNTPPIQQIKLPLQQAEQLLNAIGQYEQKAAKAKPVPAAPAPQGKDW
jgi:hypothetical protein